MNHACGEALYCPQCEVDSAERHRREGALEERVRIVALIENGLKDSGCVDKYGDIRAECVDRNELIQAIVEGGHLQDDE